MIFKLMLARIEENIPVSALASLLFGSESLKISDRTYLKISWVSLSFTGNMTSSMMPSSGSRWNSDISGPGTFSYRPRAKRILGIKRVFIQTQTLLLEAVSREILHNTPRNRRRSLPNRSKEWKTAAAHLRVRSGWDGVHPSCFQF